MDTEVRLYASDGGPREAFSGAGVDRLDWQLQTDGLYTVVIEDSLFSRTGSYNINFLKLPGSISSTNDPDGGLIACGQTLSGQINTASDLDAFQFSGSSGDRVIIRAVRISGSLDTEVRLYPPDGGTSEAFSGAGVDRLEWQLRTNGLYTIVVEDSLLTRTGSYQVTLDYVGGCFQLYLGSATVRTQQVGCLPLEASAAASLAVAVSFRVQAPSGYLTNAELSTDGRFTNATITPETDSQWFIGMRTSPTNPLRGKEIIGSICFKTIATESAFVPVTIDNLAVTNLDGSVPGTLAVGGRVVIIANKPLLEAWLNASNQRVLAIYGKPDTAYEIEQTTSLSQTSLWTLGWTNIVPNSLSYTSVLQGSVSNTPKIFLRAKEQ